MTRQGILFTFNGSKLSVYQKTGSHFFDSRVCVSTLFPITAMPIYEYQSSSPGNACLKCRRPFEVLQIGMKKPLRRCPSCGKPVKRVLSRCHAAVTEHSEEDRRVKRSIKEYESSGMWSHAAELADKHAEKKKDGALRLRALDNYRKAGYDADSLAKHAETSND